MVGEKILNEVRHYLEIERSEQAVEKVNQLLSMRPNDGGALYLKAAALYNLYRYGEAEDHCRQALANGFPALECNYLLGQIFMGVNRYVDAERHFLEALRDNPERADIMAAYGYLMLTTGHDEKAGKLMEEAQRIEPSNETVLHYKFLYHLVKDKTGDQTAALEKYFEVSDSEVGKLLKAGLMERGSGNYKAARESFRQAFLLNPADEDVLALLQDMERITSIVYLPQRTMDKIGGPAVFWVVVFVTLLILLGLGFSKAAGIVALIYIAICVWTWVAPLIQYMIMKHRR